jgi:hypothetical protein
MTYMLRIAAFFFLLLGIYIPHSFATPACIADWSIAAPIVHKEKLTTVEALSRIASGRRCARITGRSSIGSSHAMPMAGFRRSASMRARRSGAEGRGGVRNLGFLA